MIFNAYRLDPDNRNAGDRCIDDIISMRVIDSDDVVIIGGGGVIFGYTPEPISTVQVRRDFDRYLDIMELSNKSGRRLVMLGVGATRRLLREQEERLRGVRFDLVTVRDRMTKEYLECLGIESELCADVSYLAEPESYGVKRTYVFMYKWFKPEYYIFSKLDDVEYIACEPRVDYGKYYEWQDQLNIISGTVISMRVHPIIFGLIKGAKIIDMTQGKAAPIIEMHNEYGLDGMRRLAERNFKLLEETIPGTIYNK
jgi:polysaccharide pyruvyl transferase WcaK-like protein